jgi:hypothetical protein
MCLGCRNGFRRSGRERSQDLRQGIFEFEHQKVLNRKCPFVKRET